MASPARHRPTRNWGARVHEGTLRGIDAVVLENERLRVTVLPGKGTDLVEFNSKPDDLDFAWFTADGLRRPADVTGGAADDVAAFTDQYEGGWQEVFPNGGAPSTWRGVALAQHGEVAGLPWDWAVVEDTEDAVAVRFTVRTRRFPCRIDKTLRLVRGEPTLHLRETVTNDSDIELRAMWGHHVTFGAPFLRPGCRITLPDGVTALPHPGPVSSGRRRVRAGEAVAWPLLPADDGTGDVDLVDLSVVPPRGTPGELVYLTGFGEVGRYDVVDPTRGRGLRVEWDATVLPWLWYWQEFGATTDYPWWGRHYNIGLEPFSSQPTDGLAEAERNGTALTLPPRSTRDLWLRATVLTGEATVPATTRSGTTRGEDA